MKTRKQFCRFYMMELFLCTLSILLWALKLSELKSCCKKLLLCFILCRKKNWMILLGKYNFWSKQNYVLR